MQYHHRKPAFLRILKEFETTGGMCGIAKKRRTRLTTTGLVDLAERARQEIIKILRINSLEHAWDDIVGAVDSEDRETVRLIHTILESSGTIELIYIAREGNAVRARRTRRCPSSFLLCSIQGCRREA
jgi:hypothetical protein